MALELGAFPLPGGAAVLELVFPGGAELFPVVGLAVELSGLTVLPALFPGELAPGVVPCVDGVRSEGVERERASARRMGRVPRVESELALLD